MIRKDDGVVLNRVRSGDTSIVATLLAREGGKIRLVAKGALNPRSPYRGALEPGHHVEVLYYHKEERTQYFVKEVHVISTGVPSRGSLPELAGSLAVLELLDQVCYWGSPEPALLPLTLTFLHYGGRRDPLFSFLAYQFKVLETLGAAPHFDACATCGERVEEGFYHPEEGVVACSRHSASSQNRVRLDRDTFAELRRLERTPLEKLFETTVDPAFRKLLGRLLHRTYTFHVQGYSLPEALKLIPKENRDGPV